MKLIIEELKDSPLNQRIEIRQRTTLKTVRPYLCKYRYPAGTFTIAVMKGEDVVGSASQTIADAAIQASDTFSDPYWHGYLSFTFHEPLILEPGVYTLRFSADGYEYASGEFLAWVLDWDDVATPNETIAISDMAYKFELYSYQPL